MRAAVYRRYGSPEVVRLEELAKPIPGEREVLIEVKASTVSSGDWRMRSLNMPRGFGLLGRPAFGLFGPRKRVLGTELAGRVVAVGGAVTRFKEGDAVFAFPGMALGAHAEYRVMPEEGRLLPLPSGVSFEEGAAISFGGTTALYYLRDLTQLKAGQAVLVVGASGAVGSAAVQLAARYFGATVTGVTSAANVERVRALGAARVVDYTQERLADEAGRFDVVFDATGAGPLEERIGAAKERGRVLLIVATLPEFLLSGWLSRKHRRTVLVGNTPERLDDLRLLSQLVEQGLYRPLIDRTFPLERIAEAHAYVDTGRKRGSVVVTMGTATA